MSDVLRLVPEAIVTALEQMIARGSTGSLTLHFNRGMVQKIERTEYQTVPAAVKQ